MLLALGIARAASAQAEPAVPEPLTVRLAGPSPVYRQWRGPNRPRRTQAQLDLEVRSLLWAGRGREVLWGQVDNVLSTDAYDASAHYGGDFVLEKPLRSVGLGPVLLGRLGYVANQAATQQVVSTQIGARMPLWRRGAEWAHLEIGALQVDNRLRRDPRLSPNHQARTALSSRLGLSVPPFFLFTRRRAPTTDDVLHVNLSAETWRFWNEEAAPGYRPSVMAYSGRAELVVPARVLKVRMPLLRAVSLSYLTGVNQDNGFAPLTQVRLAFLFFSPTLSGGPFGRP
jgi:hypothetical protein